MSMFDGWEYKDDELVLIETVEQIAEERQIQCDVKPFLDNLGIPVNRIPETSTKTSDYEGLGVDFEVSAVQLYMPAPIARELEGYAQQFGKCQYFYTYIGNDNLFPQLEKVGEVDCMESGSALCVRQHVSIYFKKLIRKLEDKSKQNTRNPSQIIVLDFRGAPFDPVSLKRAVQKILALSGKRYPSLLGILAALPMKIDSPILSPPNYFFVQNLHSTGKNPEVLSILMKTNPVQTANVITPTPIFISRVSNQNFSIDNPYTSMPEFKELAERGLTTWPYELGNAGKLVITYE